MAAQKDAVLLDMLQSCKMFRHLLLEPHRSIGRLQGAALRGLFLFLAEMQFLRRLENKTVCRLQRDLSRQTTLLALTRQGSMSIPLLAQYVAQTLQLRLMLFFGRKPACVLMLTREFSAYFRVLSAPRLVQQFETAACVEALCPRAVSGAAALAASEDVVLLDMLQ